MRDATGDDVAHEELRDRLRAALAERYAVGEEIGSGASAVVFAARDLLHFERDVALKVIRPEVVVAVGVARFRREIQLAAQLNHPHILPLLDWGDVDGLLYYVMPRVRGESLRARLQRDQQLALDDAVRITRDIAGALQHAHGHGIAHRDVKPENILLVEGEASLGDFGLAREVERRAGEAVTASGIAVGTAMYMSPEQGSGGGGNARSDQYSLACVLYEMLAGDPPFHASTVQGMLARHRADAAPRLTTVRPSLPAGVDEALQRALAKVPAERFANVSQFATAVETALTGATLAAVRAATPAVSQPVAEGRAVKWQRAALGALAVVALGWWVVKSLEVLPGDRAPLDPNRIVVAPFDVIGTADSVWRFGLVHVLSRNLDGAGLLRAVPPSIVVRDWSGSPNDASTRQFARQAGAGLVLYGQLVPSGPNVLRLRASLLDLTSDQNLADVDLEGPSSQLLQVADSVTLLLLRGLSRSRRIASVAEAGFLTRSLPALKAFLQGEQYYRANNFSVARRYYEAAIAEDTGFAVAYRRLRGVHRAVGGEDDSVSLAYARRAGDLNRGLGRRDSLLILADSLWAAWPQSFAFFDVADQQRLRRRVQALELAVREYPGDPDARMELAEVWYHVGDRLGMSRAQALTAFESAISREPAFGPAYYHAIELAVAEREADSARQLVRRYLTVLPGDRRFQLVAGLLSPASQDRQVATRLLGEMDPDSLLGAAYVLRGSRPIRDRSEAIYRQLLTRRAVAGTDNETVAREWLALLLMGNGRPTAAADVARSGISLGTLYVTAPLAHMGALQAGEADSIFAAQIGSNGRPAVLWALAWFGRRGSLRALSQFERAYGATDSRASADPFRQYVAGAAAAYRALAQADTVAALAHFLSLPDSLCSALCLSQRIQTAQLLLSSGRTREAASLLDRFPPLDGASDGTSHAEPRWRLARAAAFLAEGDTGSAIREYVRVRDSFEPDNEWSREIVATARSALAKLERPSRP